MNLLKVTILSLLIPVAAQAVDCKEYFSNKSKYEHIPFDVAVESATKGTWPFTRARKDAVNTFFDNFEQGTMRLGRLRNDAHIMGEKYKVVYFFEYQGWHNKEETLGPLTSSDIKAYFGRYWSIPENVYRMQTKLDTGETITEKVDFSKPTAQVEQIKKELEQQRLKAGPSTLFEKEWLIQNPVEKL